ncbi:MAG: right-handed parallel beta-helix repeat-containing protein [Gammaproteobacteria bacterium]|nr:right-handed parallel beta-helix repeat-containing protein [Gammaproteobacteria bacterium]
MLADTVTTSITQTTTWTASGNPWIIRAPDLNNPISDISVASNVTLTIEPGVIIEIDGPISIIVNGTLIARGTEQAPITIRPLLATGQWRSIEFTATSVPATFNNGAYQGGSILEYANLQSGGGMSLSRPPDFPSTPANGTVYLNGGRPFINHVTIADGDAAGIYATRINSELRINNNTITNNHDTSGDKPGGIFVQGLAGSNILIEGNTVLGNSTTTVEGGGGIIVKSVDSLSLVNNAIQDNVSDEAGGGLFLLDLAGVQANYVVQDNTIAGNIADGSGGGIAIQDANVTIRGNLIRDNLTTVDFGGGIYVTGNSAVQIDGNVIKNNDAGSDGGGIYVYTAIAVNIDITNNAIIGNNTAGRGSGIFIDKDTITITNNILADNLADGNIAAMEINAGGTVSQNSVIRNQSATILAFGNPGDNITPLNFTGNNMRLNSSSEYAISNTSLILPVISGNNIVNNGIGFYIGNYAPAQLSANNNWFGTTDQATLASTMDLNVLFDAPATAMFTDVPLSPPANFNMTRSGDSVNLSWSMPPELDVAGFIVYWGNSSAPAYENAIDVGLSLSHTLTGINSSQTHYFAVTAYDVDAGAVNDDPATLLNEKQTSGHESWFTQERVAAAVTNTGGGDGGGGSVNGWTLLLMFLFYGMRRCAQPFYLTDPPRDARAQ